MAGLTKSEIVMLMKTRVPHKGCMMVQDDSDKHICLIEKELGYDRKPNACKEYNCGK